MAVEKESAGTTPSQEPDRCTVAPLGGPETWFQNAFEYSSTGMAVLSTDGRFLRVNPRLCEILGYSEEELLRIGFRDVTHPDDLQLDRRRVEAVLRGDRDSWTYEKRYLHRDGHSIWAIISFSLIRDEQNQPLCFVAQLQDIHHHKQAEEEQRRFVSLVEHCSDLIAMASAEDGRIIYMNEAGLRLVGLHDPQQAIGRHLLEFHAPETHQEINRTILPAILSEGRWEGEAQLRHFQSGRKIHVHLNAFLTRERKQGQEACLAAIMRDVTEHRRAQEALRESEERFRRAFEHAPIGMALVGVQGRLIKVNHSLARITGFSKKELLELSFHDLAHPEDVPIGLEYLERALAGESESARFEKRCIHKTGRIVWALVNISLIRDPHRRPLSFIAQIQDITAAKTAQDELQQSHQKLRQLSSHLQTVREEERVQVAREIHDELGQALTAIRFDLSWLEERLQPSQSQLRRQLAQTGQMVDQTIDSLRGILAALRPTILDDLGLPAAIEWQAKEFQERTRVRCRLRLPDSDLQLHRDVATCLFRIFQETLTNITRHAQASRVTVALTSSRDSVCLTVRDNGKGVDAERLASSHAFGILGMHERASLLGGEFKLHQPRNGGTEIRVRIPLEGTGAA